MNPSNPLPASPLATSSVRRSLGRTALLALSIAGAQASHAQAIFNATEHAEPGGVISVRGDTLDANAQFTVYPYTADGKRMTGVRADLSQANGLVALLRVPASFKNGLYEVVATTSKGATNSVFLNRPRLQWSDVTEAMPDGLVRIMGRNFKPFSGLSPKVSLKGATTSLNATIVASDDSSLTIRVPSNAAAGAYTMTVANGLAAAASTSPDSLPLNIRAKAADPFSLGVSWGADFVPIANNVYNMKTDARLAVKAKGDGVSDDTASLTANMLTISRAGGGTLYFPSGTYRIDGGGGAVIPPNVVIKGDGKGRTIFQVGYRYTAGSAPSANDCALTLWGEGAGHCGISDLTIQNLNANALANGVLRSGPSYALSSNLFIKNVEFKLGNGQQVYLEKIRKAVIADCDLTSTSLQQGPVSIADVQDAQIVRNNFTYRVARTYLLASKRIVFESNRIMMDNAFHTNDAIETGGLETSLSQQVLVSDNDVVGYNGPVTKDRGDAEMIMTQLSNVPDYGYVGTVRAISGRVMVPAAPFSTTIWQSPNHAPLPRMAIMILSGKGAGQWRWATSWTTASVMVDRPWQVNPDTTSRFTVTPLSCYGQTIVNNRMSGGYIGVELYNGAVDSVISGNTQMNTGQIVVRGYCWANDVRGGNYGFLPVWDVSIVKNTVSENDMGTPACISAATIDTSSSAFGLLTAGVDIRYNSVNGNFRPKLVSEIGAEEGLEVLNWYYNGKNTDTVNNVGTILENNSVTKVQNPINIRGGVSVGEFNNATISVGVAAVRRP